MGRLLLALLFTGFAWTAASADVTDDALFAPLAAQSLLLDATRAGARMVAVGEYGHVLLSDDEGENWRQAQHVPTRTTLTAVTFVDDRLGWAVGHGGQILHSVDGGERWTVQYGKADGADSLFSVWFENAEHGLAVGPYGYALTTLDGGKSWAQIQVADGEDGERHLNRIFAGADGRLYIAAEIGGVFISDDRGAHWRLVQTPYDGSLWGGTVRRDGSVIVVGMVGHALLSADRGEHWTMLETDTDQSLTDVTELPDGRVVLVGLGGAVAIGSASLVFKSEIRPDRQFTTSVLAAAGKLLLFTQSGVHSQSLAAP